VCGGGGGGVDIERGKRKEKDIITNCNLFVIIFILPISSDKQCDTFINTNIIVKDISILVSKLVHEYV
jgi:hypothetical protein